MTQELNEPWVQDKEYTKYTLWFIYACIIYSIIGFSWGALMGGIPAFRDIVDYTPPAWTPDSIGAYPHQFVGMGGNGHLRCSLLPCSKIGSPPYL